MFYPCVIDLCKHTTLSFFILKRKLQVKPLHKKSEEFAAASPSHQQYMTDRVHFEVPDSPTTMFEWISVALLYQELYISTALEGCSSPTTTHKHSTYESTNYQ